MSKRIGKLGFVGSVILLIAMLCLLSACGNASGDADSAAGTDGESCVHSFGEWTTEVAATCSAEGKLVRICSKCDERETSVLPKTDHVSVIDAAVEEGCETEGATEGKHCSICSLVLEAQEKLPATGHQYSESIEQEATCIESGIKRFTCDRCEDTYTEELAMPEYDASEIYEMASATVGEIITYDKNANELSLGSGFTYASNGIIVTNYHVIEGAYSAQITINGSTYQISQVLTYDKDKDLALLKINANALPTLPLCSQPLQAGKTVYALGSSRGLTATFSQGIITYADREIDGVTYVQHDAAISGGNSGGPLINQYAEIIGVNTMAVEDSQNLNFAVFAFEVEALFARSSNESPLTMSEFYEKECDRFTTLKNYIVENGTWVSSTGYYRVLLGSSVSSDGSDIYYRHALYYVDDNEIALSYYIDSGYMLSITIDEIDGTYTWSFIDDSDNFIYGNLYAASLTTTTEALTYLDTTITYAPLLNVSCQLSASMARSLCINLTRDLSEIGITAADLGFVNFP